MATIVGILFVISSLINSSAEVKAVLVREYGDIYYASDRDSYQLLNTDEIEIDFGTYVKTGSGKANIILPNNSVIYIDENTELKVEFNYETFDIQQFIGNTWHRIRNLGGTSYEVTTPNAIAAVRGTIFGVRVEEVNNVLETYVVVTENTVAVSKLNLGKLNEEVGSVYEVVDVTEGMYTIIEEGKPLKVAQITEEIKISTWFIRGMEEIEKEEDGEIRTIKTTDTANTRSKNKDSKQDKTTSEQETTVTVTVTPTESQLSPTPTPLPTQDPGEPTPTDKVKDKTTKNNPGNNNNTGNSPADSNNPANDAAN
ncbi:MAG TPA: FecR family protein [Candidatus Dojkabacteria bacterium]|nr:FecR family protein [Candidatus Dojkabacteria bacterium]